MKLLNKIIYRKSIIDCYLIKRNVYVRNISLPNSKEKVKCYTVELTYKPASLKTKATSFKSVADAEKRALKELNEKYQAFIKENPNSNCLK